jgi:predicted lipoprotein
MDDWMGIQHMRFGPVDLYLRYSRYQLWPDKHGTGAKQLKSLLADQPFEQLTPDRFPYTSVAVQGFTSLERLLFPTQLDLASFGAAKQPSFQCELVTAIASNLANISEGIVHDWTTGKIAYREQIQSAQGGNDYFESSEEVSSRLLNDLYTQLQSIVDQKLMRPLENHQLRRAESWRSRRSLRNIELNLQGIEALYRVGFSPLATDQTLDAEIKAAFADAIQSIQAVKSPLYEIPKDSESLELVQRVLADCRKLKSLIATRLTVALNLPLGFNSLDGD